MKLSESDDNPAAGAFATGRFGGGGMPSESVEEEMPSISKPAFCFAVSFCLDDCFNKSLFCSRFVANGFFNMPALGEAERSGIAPSSELEISNQFFCFSSSVTFLACCVPVCTFELEPDKVCFCVFGVGNFLAGRQMSELLDSDKPVCMAA